MINHGTRGGYYAHRRLNHDDPDRTPCDECRAAINEYVRGYRQKNGLTRNRKGEKIRRMALAELRDTYREEYDKIVERIESETDDD